MWVHENSGLFVRSRSGLNHGKKELRKSWYTSSIRMKAMLLKSKCLDIQIHFVKIISKGSVHCSLDLRCWLHNFWVCRTRKFLFFSTYPWNYIFWAYVLYSQPWHAYSKCARVFPARWVNDSLIGKFDIATRFVSVVSKHIFCIIFERLPLKEEKSS